MKHDQAEAASRYRACVIAASSGGIAALRMVLAALDARLRLRVMVLLHSAAPDSDALVALLGRSCALPMQEAQMGQSALPGHVYIAPPGLHLLLEKDGSFAFSADDKVCFVRPSADVLFESATDCWRDALIGVVLTGANDDGARGLRLLRSEGGLAIVQSPEEAEAPEMPAAALLVAGADHVLPLAEIAPLLNQLGLPA